MQAPEEQSTVLELSHCQKEVLDPPGEAEDSGEGFVGFAVPESGWTPALALIALAWDEAFGFMVTWSTALFRVLFAERKGGPPMSCDDSANAK